MSRRGDGHLFVGRLAKDVRTRDLEDVFELYGRLTRCDIKYGNNFALVELIITVNKLIFLRNFETKWRCLSVLFLCSLEKRVSRKKFCRIITKCSLFAYRCRNG